MACATAALATQWMLEYGWNEGLFYSVFHAVSAFNNAGFALWESTLVQCAGSTAVNIATSFSFIIGGIGFTVLYDVGEKTEILYPDAAFEAVKYIKREED